MNGNCKTNNSVTWEVGLEKHTKTKKKLSYLLTDDRLKGNYSGHVTPTELHLNNTRAHFLADHLNHLNLPLSRAAQTSPPCSVPPAHLKPTHFSETGPGPSYAIKHCTYSRHIAALIKMYLVSLHFHRKTHILGHWHQSYLGWFLPELFCKDFLFLFLHFLSRLVSHIPLGERLAKPKVITKTLGPEATLKKCFPMCAWKIYFLLKIMWWTTWTT